MDFKIASAANEFLLQAAFPLNEYKGDIKKLGKKAREWDEVAMKGSAMDMAKQDMQIVADYLNAYLRD